MSRCALALLLLTLPLQAVAAPQKPLVAEPTPQALSPFDDVRRSAERQVKVWQKRAAKLEVAWRADMPGPALLTDLGERLDPARFQDQGLAWAQHNAGLWGLQSADWSVLHVQKGKLRTTLRLSQTALVSGIRVPVLQRGMALTIDAQGQMVSVTSEAVPLGKLTLERIAKADAQKTALKAVLGLREDRNLPLDRVHRCELAVLAGPTEARLVWAVDIVVQAATDRRAVLIDAETGVLLSQRSAVHH